jgi:hypothetical protein
MTRKDMEREGDIECKVAEGQKKKKEKQRKEEKDKKDRER